MADNFKDAEEIFEMYSASQNQIVQELTNTITVLRTKITYLEKQLKDFEESSDSNLPSHIKWKIDKLENENKSLKRSLKDANDTPVSSYFEKEFKKVLKEKEEMERDLEYYKKKVPVQVIINREKKNNPTRGGGQLR